MRTTRDPFRDDSLGYVRAFDGEPEPEPQTETPPNPAEEKKVEEEYEEEEEEDEDEWMDDDDDPEDSGNDESPIGGMGFGIDYAHELAEAKKLK